jgi:DNA-binding GntR family transcriptional regulator
MNAACSIRHPLKDGVLEIRLWPVPLKELTMISRGKALRDQVYENLRDRIVNGELHPGDVLVEVELAGQLNVSRTPVSNALVMLRERGLIHDVGGRMEVSVLKLEDVVHLYWCRMGLDGIAARLAATRITDAEIQTLESYLKAWETPVQESDLSALWVSDLKFHHHIYEVSGNRHLIRFSEIAAELAAVYRRNTIRRMSDPQSGTSRSRDDVRTEHTAIFDAIAARAPDAAERAARHHIHMVIKHLEQADMMLEVSSPLQSV